MYETLLEIVIKWPEWPIYGCQSTDSHVGSEWEREWKCSFYCWFLLHPYSIDEIIRIFVHPMEHRRLQASISILSFPLSDVTKFYLWFLAFSAYRFNSLKTAVWRMDNWINEGPNRIAHSTNSYTLFRFSFLFYQMLHFMTATALHYFICNN